MNAAVIADEEFNAMVRYLFPLTGLILFAATAEAQTSSYEEFLQLGELKVGRWMSKVTLISDWKDIGYSAGDEVNGYSTFTWKSDKRAFIEEETVGKSIETTLYFFDLNEKRIRSIRIGSDGTTSFAVWWKKERVWHWKIEKATVGGGNELTGEGTSTFGDDGTTMIRDGTAFLDGKELPHYHDVYTKVSKR